MCNVLSIPAGTDSRLLYKIELVVIQLVVNSEFLDEHPCADWPIWVNFLVDWLSHYKQHPRLGSVGPSCDQLSTQYLG